jgi:hypothetical protein
MSQIWLWNYPNKVPEKNYLPEFHRLCPKFAVLTVRYIKKKYIGFFLLFLCGPISNFPFIKKMLNFAVTINDINSKDFLK